MLTFKLGDFGGNGFQEPLITLFIDFIQLPPPKKKGDIYLTWALFSFLKIGHIGIIRCAKYILQTKHMDLYIENNFSLL